MSTDNRVSLGRSPSDVTSLAAPEMTPASSRSGVDGMPPRGVPASQPLFDWWLHHWMDIAHPMARWHSAWVDAVFEAMAVEVDFLHACTTSNARAWRCLAATRQRPAFPGVPGCIHEAAREVADAHLVRLGRVAELPEDFQQRLWEEIC